MSGSGLEKAQEDLQDFEKAFKSAATIQSSSKKYYGDT
jgi:hypothetical protein